MCEDLIIPLSDGTNDKKNQSTVSVYKIWVATHALAPSYAGPRSALIEFLQNHMEQAIP